MTGEQQQRLEFLAVGSCAPIAYIADYYGLSWPFAGELAHDYQLWRDGPAAKTPQDCPAGHAPRFMIERFMQIKRVVPRKWMAARLGMTESSFNELVERLPDVGLRPRRYVVYDAMIAESLSEDIVPALRALRFRTFSDHNSFCERLHAAVADELKIAVEPLLCATANAIGDYPRQFASDFDCLTLEPVSGRHQIWLDFGKPMNLAPDRCSKLFYLENRDVLEPYRAGTREPDLTAYEQFVGDTGHAG